MLEAMNTWELTNGRVLKIYPDSNPENPREWENLATFVCGHRRYKLGDIQAEDGSPAEFAGFIKRVLEEDVESHYLTRSAKQASIKELRYLERLMKRGFAFALAKVAMVVPLYMYEHSGIALSTTPFNDHWDSGKLGYVFVTNARIRAECTGGKYVQNGDQGPTVWQPGSGIITKQRREQVRKIIECEVETYDQYLRGECYGYAIIDPADDEEPDILCGFYGDPHNVIYAFPKEVQAVLRKKYPEEFPKKAR